METVERAKQLTAISGLRPDDCLPSESDLYDGLDISRSLLRGAVRAFDTLGIIEIQHGRRTFIGNAALRPLVETLTFRMNMLPGRYQHAPLEVVEMRREIDLGEVEQVCSTLRGTGDKELHWLVDQITRATGEGKPLAELDRGFHVILMNRTGRRIAMDLAAACWDIQTMTSAKLPPGTVIDLSGVHAEILGVAEVGDVDGYR